MSEIADTISEAVEKADGSRINTIVAISVAITATFTALWTRVPELRGGAA